MDEEFKHKGKTKKNQNDTRLESSSSQPVTHHQILPVSHLTSEANRGSKAPAHLPAALPLSGGRRERSGFFYDWLEGVNDPPPGTQRVLPFGGSEQQQSSFYYNYMPSPQQQRLQATTPSYQYGPTPYTGQQSQHGLQQEHATGSTSFTPFPGHGYYPHGQYSPYQYHQVPTAYPGYPNYAPQIGHPYYSQAYPYTHPQISPYYPPHIQPQQHHRQQSSTLNVAAPQQALTSKSAKNTTYKKDGNKTEASAKKSRPDKTKSEPEPRVGTSDSQSATRTNTKENSETVTNSNNDNSHTVTPTTTTTTTSGTDAGTGSDSNNMTPTNSNDMTGSGSGNGSGTTKTSGESDHSNSNTNTNTNTDKTDKTDSDNKTKKKRRKGGGGVGDGLRYLQTVLNLDEKTSGVIYELVPVNERSKFDSDNDVLLHLRKVNRHVLSVEQREAVQLVKKQLRAIKKSNREYSRRKRVNASIEALASAINISVEGDTKKTGSSGERVLTEAISWIKEIKEDNIALQRQARMVKDQEASLDIPLQSPSNQKSAS